MKTAVRWDGGASYEMVLDAGGQAASPAAVCDVLADLSTHLDPGREAAAPRVPPPLGARRRAAGARDRVRERRYDPHGPVQVGEPQRGRRGAASEVLEFRTEAVAVWRSGKRPKLRTSTDTRSSPTGRDRASLLFGCDRRRWRTHRQDAPADDAAHDAPRDDPVVLQAGLQEPAAVGRAPWCVERGRADLRRIRDAPERQSEAAEGRFGQRLEQDDQVADVEGCSSSSIARESSSSDPAEGRVFSVFVLRHAVRGIVHDHNHGQRQRARVSTLCLDHRTERRQLMAESGVRRSVPRRGPGVSRDGR